MADQKGIYGVDRWVCGVRVVASDIDTASGRFGGTLRVNAGGVLNASLAGATEDWWLYVNPFATTEQQDFHARYPSFYLGVVAALTTAAGGTWTIGAYTLAGSATERTGLWINWSGGAWSIDWDNTNMNPEWFGFPRDATGVTSSDAGGTIRSPKSVKPQWVSNSLNDGRASKKFPSLQQIVKHSSDRASEAYSNPYSTELFRQFEYMYCPEVTTLGELIDSTPDAKIARVSPGDNFNCFLDVYEYMSLGREVIIVHNTGDEDNEVIGHQYEVSVLSIGQRESSDKVISDSGIAGRFYNITPIMVRLEGTYGALTK